MLDKVKGGLIVSCQALPEEPLHSSFIMGRMALAADQGGAVGIRANTASDIHEIEKNTKLPIIGIVKRDYEGTPIYITPTMKEIEELAETSCAMIALDATDRVRFQGQKLEEFIKEVSPKIAIAFRDTDLPLPENKLFWGKYATSVLNTLDRYKIKYYLTRDSGSVSVMLEKDGRINTLSP